MNKPEYSDLYRFLVSLGVILIASSVLMPWLFLRESFDTHIKASELAEYTDAAQTLISIRQGTALWFIQNIAWISLIPTVLGGFFLIYGLFLWQRKQKILDHKDVLETEKLELEIRNMSPEQIAVKALEEVAIETEEDVSEEARIQETRKQVTTVQEYFRTEDMVVKKLSMCFGSINIRSHQMIGNSKVDILARVSSRVRVIIEVKRVTSSTYVNRRKRDVIDILNRSVRSYNSISPGVIKAYGVGIIIISEDQKSNSRSGNYEKFSTSTIDNNVIATLIFTEEEFALLDCVELKSMITSLTNIN